ncbi:hypothetical protein OROHE_011721 [Orobanche hederae]
MLDVPSNVVQKKRVARILVFKIRPSQEILKIRDGTPLEAEGILTYRKSPRNCSVWHFSSKLDVPSNVVQKKSVSRILVFKIRPFQEILKIRDAPLEAEGILTFGKRPSQEILKIRDVQNKIVARILVFKIRPSQDILKIRDGTPLEAEGILTYRKSPRNCSVWHFSSKLDVPRNVVQKKRVARILVFKIRPSQEILKIRDGTPLEAQGILTYRKRPSKLIAVPSNVVQKKIVARILVFKIRPSQDILKIRDGTPLEAEGILTYRKSPRNCSVWHFSSKLDVPSNVVQKKRVARILVFKIRPSQEILKIRDGTPLEAEGILTYRKRPSQEILKIRDGTPLEKILKIRDGTPLEKILKIRDGTPLEKRVARILVFKIRPSQEILKIRDGTPLEAEGILTYRKRPSKLIVKKRVARILVFKISPSQEILKIRDLPSQDILKIRDGTPLEAEGILTYREKPSKLIKPSQEILKIRDEILKIRDGTPLEAEGILTFRKRPSQDILKIRDGTPLEWPSQEILKIRDEILKIRDGTPLEAEGILTFRKRPSQEILKIRDGTPLEAEGILTYIKKPSQEILKIRDGTPLELAVPSNVVQKKRVARILVFKIRPSQEILKIRDGTPLEAEGILTYRKRPSQEILKIRDGTPLEWPSQDILKIRDGTPLEKILKIRDEILKIHDVQKKRVARILVFKIRPSQEILKIRDGTPLEAEGILTYRKRPSKLIVKKRVARILVFKISPSQEILKILARILVFKIRPSQDILKIRDGTPLEAEGILTYREKPSKLIKPSQEILKIRDVARILVFKISPSQEILKIRDGTPLEAEGILTFRKRMARILVFKIRPSQEILKIRDGTPLEWPSQEILKIRDGTPLEAEGILTYRKKPSKLITLLAVPSNVVQNKIVARILVFKIRPSQDILKIRDGTPLEAEGILTYRKSPRNCSVWHFSSKLDVPRNVVQKKRVARILVFKIRPSQEILKIRDGTPLEAEGILTYRKRPSKLIGLALF